MEETDFYEVLRLHPEADHEMIVGAYWHRVRLLKAEMDTDAGAAKELQALNEAFAVLGSPEQRAEYDSERANRLEYEESSTRRVAIDVSFWYLSAWQGMLAATATLALAVTAILSGAQPLITLALALVAIVAVLVVLPPERAAALAARWPFTQRRRREAKIAELERATSAIIARWRASNPPSDGTPIIHILRGNDDYTRRPTPRRR